MGWGMNRAKAQQLRNNPTEAERTLWYHVRRRQLGGYKFRRQHPLGPNIADFVCLEKNLIIEFDGGQHSQQTPYDSERTDWLEAQGFRVLRFWNNEVFKSIDTVKEVIVEALREKGGNPLLDLPPSQGRRSQC